MTNPDAAAPTAAADVNQQSVAPSKMALDDRLIAKLRAILARTQSPEEGEAATAMEMLQRFLLQHNLSVADLESKGQQAKAKVTERGIDLGKAAFTWKLDLAESIAEHYFCVGIVNRYDKTKKATITFIGRPDNVESLNMLYNWVMEQIKRLAAESRKLHQVENGQHIDPLRWQVNFGSGCVARLMDRLGTAKANADANTTSLVIHHMSEISDYTEEKYDRRYDGEDTEKQKKRNAYWEAYYERRDQERAEQKAKDQEWLDRDPVGYYEEHPDRHPREIERRTKEAARREARNQRRRENYVPRGRWSSSRNADKEEQGYTAHQAGRAAGDKVNLEPFLTGKVAGDGKLGKGGK